MNFPGIEKGIPLFLKVIMYVSVYIQVHIHSGRKHQ